MGAQHNTNTSMPATNGFHRRTPQREKTLHTAGRRGRQQPPQNDVRQVRHEYLEQLSFFEEETTKELVHMFPVENEDELAVSLDLHQLVGLKKGERRAFLESMLQACASNATPAFIDKCLERISKLDARVSDATSAAGPTTTFGEGSPPFHHTGRLAGNSLVRMMSAKYDMDTLRELSRSEEEAMEELVKMFQVENEDELPVSFDLHQLVGLKEGERRAFLESMLQACSSDEMPAFIDKCLERISKLDARVSDAISVTGPTTTFATEQHRETLHPTVECVRLPNRAKYEILNGKRD